MQATGGWRYKGEDGECGLAINTAPWHCQSCVPQRPRMCVEVSNPDFNPWRFGRDSSLPLPTCLLRALRFKSPALPSKLTQPLGQRATLAEGTKGNLAHRRAAVAVCSVWVASGTPASLSTPSGGGRRPKEPGTGSVKSVPPVCFRVVSPPFTLSRRRRDRLLSL